MTAAVLPTASTPPGPLLQRRYSVSGKTLPDDVGAIKSPLQALDTSVQATSCGLCESGGAAAGAVAGGGGESSQSTLFNTVPAPAPSGPLAHTTRPVVRTSSKRSATQLPSPSTPSSQELPTKIARLGLGHHGYEFGNVDDSLTDPGSEKGEWFEDDASMLGTPPSLSMECECEHARKEADEDMVMDTDMQVEDIPRVFSQDFQGELPQAPSLASPTLLTLPTLSVLHAQTEQPPPPPPSTESSTISPTTFLTLPQKSQHPLAAVSRQIRSESLAIFHSYNIWIIKLEFKIMYDAFQDWIIRLGPDAGNLRIVHIAVRGRLFKPWTSHASSSPAFIHHNNNVGGAYNFVPGGGVPLPGSVVPVESYSPPDGDASFRIDLSEKWVGGKVEVLRNDGTGESGAVAKAGLEKLVVPMWERRKAGVLNGQDWVDMVDAFLRVTGGGSW
ncbi:hypothetical protein B0J11DRAFT_593612 [Dendryphion nanum]|uniref:Uncharacterized protein n=1 Tax=Dendryphion nanum TaxID=256645 RepID=A0A9P9DB11_9PLEO|nr:hypothetical protein B0J11DRAFT_593612 [Dendryphion nanum]